MQEKYGFVYIWYDRKRKMFYIGSHWGTEDDGYVCSSNRMRDAYRRRPNDFKRRILSRIYTNRKELFDEEQKWFDLVKKKSRYYNLSFSVKCHWSNNEETKLTVGQKISKSLTGVPLSQERLEKRKNLIFSEKHRENLSKAGIGRIFDKETREKIARANRKTYHYINPTGEVIKVDNIQKFCRENGLHESPMRNLYNGKYMNDTYKGWKAFHH